MQFVTPTPFTEAIDKLGARSFIASQFTSSEWRDVPVALRERAFFSSTVESLRFLQRARDGISDYLTESKETLPNGQTALKIGSRADFVAQMQGWALQNGMADLVPPEKRRGLQDITSERRLGLIFDTQDRQAKDYGYWKQGMDADVLDEFPAQRFIRIQEVQDPREYHQQFEGLVRLKTDLGFWTAINQDFGVPWGPWGWGCGHDVEDVDRAEAEQLGLLAPNQPAQPAVQDFNDHLEASTRNLDADLLQSLREAFADQVTIEDDSIRWHPRPEPLSGARGGFVTNPDDRDPFTRDLFNDQATVDWAHHELSQDQKQQAIRLSGAMDGSDIRLVTQSNGLALTVRHQYIDGTSIRILRPDKTIHNDVLILRDDAPAGLGTRIFATQVKHAQAAGYTKIDTLAAGAPNEPGWNGYYTWPRLGYDTHLQQYERAALPAPLQHATTVLDLMQSPEGRRWWLDYGRGRAMEFDLTPGSRSIRTLYNYLEEKGIAV